MNLGWDGESVSHTHVYNPQESASDATSIKTKFITFIRSFMLGGVYIYRDQLRSNLTVKNYYIEVQLEHLASYDSGLFELVKRQPNSVIGLFEEGVKSLAEQTGIVETVPFFQVMLLLHQAPTPIRMLATGMMCVLVRVSGIVVSASQLTAKATSVHIMCKSCRHVKVCAILQRLSL